MSSLRAALTDVYIRHGELTPALVVDEARPVDHPLHNRFDWNDSTAAEKYRQVQAAELIRSVKIVYAHKPEKSVRGFMSVQRADDDQVSRSYVPTEEAVANDFTHKLLLAECKREWQAFKAKYDHLAEFAAIVRNGISGAA